MIEINSSKINKKLLEDEIEKNLKSYVIKERIQEPLHTDTSAKQSREHKETIIYHIDDFHKYNDKDFIKNIYVCVLRREVDLPALQHYLHLLRTGQKSKTEILAIIRFSKEGRLQNVKIIGIHTRYIMAVTYSIPILSYLIKMIVILLRLPSMLQRYNSLEAHFLMHQQDINKEIIKKMNLDDFFHDISNIEKKFTTQYETFSLKSEKQYKDTQEQYSHTKEQYKDIQEQYNHTQEQYNHTQEQYNHTQEQYNHTQEQYSHTKEQYKDIQEQYSQTKRQVQLYLNDVNNSISYLRTVETNLKNSLHNIEVLAVEQESMHQIVHDIVTEEKKHLLDNLYISFEDRFRGKREDIKQRQAYYLPFVKDVVKETIEIVLDIGCGRGEWMELLRDNFINAKGVDLNRAMVQKSVDFGLDAITMDAIAYLKSLENESLSVITGFHIVEHLPFEVLIQLLDESLRVLKRGGMIIYETPNPENLLVGSCTFYTDPTHINPIPPATLEFLVQNRGFTNTTIHRLHPIKEPQYIEGLNRDDINNLIYASTKEQDYSIIGYKA